ncbi:MAG: isochorismatase family protein [Acidimicrobiia bacterium]
MITYGETTALIVVDVQNDFAHPDGSLFVSGAPRVMTSINEQADAAAAAGSLVVRTQDWHPESTPHFAKDGGIWPVHCVADSWGAEFHADCTATGPVVRKGTNGEDGYSGFTMRDPTSGDEIPTELGGMLTAHGIDTVVVVGLATDYCVLATCLDAVRLGYETIVVADGIAAVDLEPGDGARAIATMVDAGVTVR